MPGFLSFSYWFSLYPPALLHSVQVVLLAIFILLIVVGLGVLYGFRPRATSKSRREVLSRIGHTFLWAGITGAIWLFMTVNTVPLLGMRIWLVIGAVFFGWLLVRPIRTWRVTIPVEERASQSRASYEKWLPKPKK